jgi:hypothetical protein
MEKFLGSIFSLLFGHMMIGAGLYFAYNGLAMYIPQAPQHVAYVDCMLFVLLCRMLRASIKSWPKYGE